MSDGRSDGLARVVAGVEGAACWLARVATKAALAGGAAGGVLWWMTVGERVTDWWRGTAVAALVLVVCLAPALWLLNVRTAMVDLVELPDRLEGVARRRTGRLRGRPNAAPPDGGPVAAVRSVRAVLRDYGDVSGSWGTVAQLVVPSFWALTLAALVAVPLLAVAAVVAVVVG